MFDLTRLLAPMSVETYLRDFYEKRPLFLQRGEGKYYEGLLSIDDIDRVVTSTRLRFPPFRLVRGGNKIPLEEYLLHYPLGEAPSDALIDAQSVTRRYVEGETIVVEAFHRSCPPVGDLCRSLEQRFGFPVHANVYLTPRSSQGFVMHYDDHDVFVLQLEGTKRWKVHEPYLPLPSVRMPYRREACRSTALSLDVDFQPGDLLYLPRGYLHEAATSSSDSLHLTLGLAPVTWYNVVATALEQLEEVDEDCRRSLPPGTTFDPLAAQALRSRYREMVMRLLDRIDLEAVLERMAERFVGGRFPLVRGMFAQAWDWETIGAKSVVTIRPGLLHRLRVIPNRDSINQAVGSSTPMSDPEGRVVLSFLGKQMEFPASMEPAVRRLASGEPCIAGRLLGLDEASGVELVSRLVKEGFLVCERE